MAERAVAILEYIVQEGGSVPVSDIIEELAVPKPTAYRLVEWFEGLGFLAREPGRSRVPPHYSAMGELFLAHMPAR